MGCDDEGGQTFFKSSQLCVATDRWRVDTRHMIYSRGNVQAVKRVRISIRWSLLLKPISNRLFG